MKDERILITVSGPDRPGITAALMDCVGQGDHAILDMGQSVTHGLLSLSIFLKLGTEHQDQEVLKELLFVAKKMNLHLDFQVINDDGEVPHLKKETEKFILSCVSVNGITAPFLRDVAGTLAHHNINILRIDNMTGSEFKGLEITTQIFPGAQTHPENKERKLLKSELMALSNKHQIDLAFLRDDIFRRNKRLIVFDMDSTLIQSEVIDEMAMLKGVGDQVKKITERAMNGEMDFNQSLTSRLSLLKGLKTSDLMEIMDKLTLTEGTADFIQTVKGLGLKTAIISGGFTFFANYLKNKLGIDYAFANELEIVDNELTGKVLGTLINAEQKALLLDFLAQKEGIPLEQVVAIGDGANDLPMLAKAGLGIAFHAKEIVKKNAPHHMGHGPMTSILYFLGIPGKLTLP